MATKIASSTILTDIAKFASVLGIFGLAMDYRSEKRAEKWHRADGEEAERRHRETVGVLREILEEMRKKNER